ncbi:MAG: PEP-CTERM sorting domain-containing protein [Planctomycetota bacterium]
MQRTLTMMLVLAVVVVSIASMASAAMLDIRVDFNNAAGDPAGNWNTLDQDTVNDPTVITDAPLIDYNTGQATPVTVSTAGTRRSTMTATWDSAETGPAWLDPAQDAANDYFWQSQGSSVDDTVSMVVTLKGLTPGAAYTVELISSHNTTAQSFRGCYDINGAFFDGSSTGTWNFKTDGYEDGGWMTWTEIVADTEGQLVLTATPIYTDSGWNKGGVRVNAMSVVPEPATMALLGMGALGLLRRRR